MRRGQFFRRDWTLNGCHFPIIVLLPYRRMIHEYCCLALLYFSSTVGHIALDHDDVGLFVASILLFVEGDQFGRTPVLVPGPQLHVFLLQLGDGVSVAGILLFQVSDPFGLDLKLGLELPDPVLHPQYGRVTYQWDLGHLITLRQLGMENLIVEHLLVRALPYGLELGLLILREEHLGVDFVPAEVVVQDAVDDGFLAGLHRLQVVLVQEPQDRLRMDLIQLQVVLLVLQDLQVVLQVQLFHLSQQHTMAVAELQQLNWIQVLHIAFEAFHDALYVLADAQILDDGVVLGEIREAVDDEGVPVQGLENCFEVWFGEVGQVQFPGVVRVGLLKVLRLDRKEGDLQLVLAHRRLDCYVGVRVDGEVQQQLGIGYVRQFYFHVATDSIQILYSCFFKFGGWT